MSLTRILDERMRPLLEKGEFKLDPSNIWTPCAVLYLLVDDLRPQLSIYGKTYMHTPNVERRV